MELLQVRVDKETKAQATELFTALGMDLSTAIRAFLKKAISEGGMPFDLRLKNQRRDFFQAVEAMRETSEANGNSDMTLEEINAEIAAARKERKKRK